MQFSYKTNGVCSKNILIDVENGIVNSVRFDGGCNGNTKGISALVEGMKVEDVIQKLENIKCGFKSTSCPAQLAQALKQIDKKSVMPDSME